MPRDHTRPGVVEGEAFGAPVPGLWRSDGWLRRIVDRWRKMGGVAEPPSVQDALKQAVGRAAADLVEDGMRIGLGTGSTVRHTTIALGERGLDLTCVATSVDTERLAAEVGLTVSTPDEVGHLDLAVDGADEVDPDLHLVKGGGGAHTREKLVAAMADRFVVVVDESKLVDRLGDFRVPVEVLPFAPGVVEASLRGLGATSVERRDEESDNGNVLVDADFGLLDTPVALGDALAGIPGVVDHGIFPGDMVERVLVGKADGTVSTLTH